MPTKCRDSDPPLGGDLYARGTYSEGGTYMLVYTVLTIPAMSAAPERLFSSANITISDRCNRLHGDTTEAIECLKSWRKIQNIQPASDEVELKLDQVTI
jgi:hypothetical protein